MAAHMSEKSWSDWSKYTAIAVAAEAHVGRRTLSRGLWTPRLTGK